MQHAYDEFDGNALFECFQRFINLKLIYEVPLPHNIMYAFDVDREKTEVISVVVGDGTAEGGFSSKLDFKCS